ncbi:unnamed protein product [Ectocarpus sp. 6 AP-2014]
MKQVTKATRRGWILLLLVLTARCQACEAGSAAGATSWRKRGVLNTASCASDGRHSSRCCRIDEAARSVLGLRGGSRASIGGGTSAPREGGRLHGGDADLSAGGNVSPDGVKENQEHKGGLVEEAKWLDRAESGVQPKTAPAYQLVLRGCFLLLVFLFPLLSAGLAYLSSWFREKVWYRALTYSIGKSGTAFIKWGQWSSTRPDMFPEGLCESLSVLHKGAPSHKLAHTKKLVERAYGGRPISEVFAWFESKPIASGSIAQIHKAILNGEVVAVKVRHPKVKERMFLDFLLMKKIASFADRNPSLKWMNLGPSMEQFSNTMSAQTDLVLEAKHLNEFNLNFNGEAWSDCAFPTVIHCVEDVLVETFEEGIVVAEYAKLFAKTSRDKNVGLWERGLTKLLGRPSRQRENSLEGEKPDPALGHFIVTRGEDMWLKMVLNDGLLHADLHPGNILVHAPKDGTSAPRLVLVDAGMVAKLYGHQQRHFVRLLECLGSGDGIAAGQAVLQFSTKQTCVGEHEQAAFLAEMDSVFKEKCRGYHTAIPAPLVCFSQNVDVGNILRGVLTCVRRHSVRVDVEYATLILNILCLDGMSKVLLPTYNILDGAQSLLEAQKVGRRLVGGFGVKTILPLARALKWRQDRKFLRKLNRDAKKAARNAKRGRPDSSRPLHSNEGNGIDKLEDRAVGNPAAATVSAVESTSTGVLDAERRPSSQPNNGGNGATSQGRSLEENGDGGRDGGVQAVTAPPPDTSASSSTSRRTSSIDRLREELELGDNVGSEIPRGTGGHSDTGSEPKLD